MIRRVQTAPADYEGFPGIHPGRMKRMLQDQSAESVVTITIRM